MDKEDGYYAVMACTAAKALRQEARKFWNIPLEEDLSSTGNDWALILLDKESKNKLMFIW
jgi:hypothetical protein